MGCHVCDCRTGVGTQAVSNVLEMSFDRAKATLPASLRCGRASRLKERAHELIPGGAHTYAKGDDQYPEEAPAFIERGRGCRVWDVDGNEFIEYGMGLRAVTLGHAYPPVVEAAQAQMLQGTNFVRPAPIEVACAEALLELLPRADMVKFCKDGSTANTAAITLARAHTGRDLVAICADDAFCLVQRLVHGDDADGCRHPAGSQRAYGLVPLQRPCECFDAVRGAPGTNRVRDSRARAVRDRRGTDSCIDSESCAP